MAAPPPMSPLPVLRCSTTTPCFVQSDVHPTAVEGGLVHAVPLGELPHSHVGPEELRANAAELNCRERIEHLDALDGLGPLRLLGECPRGRPECVGALVQRLGQGLRLEFIPLNAHLHCDLAKCPPVLGVAIEGESHQVTIARLCER